MSLLINGMGMPDSCRHCRFCIPTEPDCDGSPYECVLNDYLHWVTWLDVPSFVSEGCKLIELPSHHGKLIDADKVLSEIREIVKANTERGKFTFAVDIFRPINNAPTVIDAEE